MKLMQKTARLYLIFSAVLMLLAGGILYLFLNWVVQAETTEKLLVNAERISIKLQAGESVAALPPVIEIDTFDDFQADTTIIKKVLLFDPIEAEEETFREIYTVLNHNGTSYALTLRQVILEPHDFLNSIGLALVFIFGALLTLLWWLNRRFFKKMWLPFYQNLGNLKAFSLRQDDNIAWASSSITEFQELKAVAERLTNKVRSDYQALKAFTENAAHEIQTPLAIISSRLEDSLQTPDLPKSQARHIQVAMSAVHRLSRLNRALLLLSKIENRQFEGTSSLSVMEQLDKLLLLYEDFIREKQLSLLKNIGSDTQIEAHPVLLETLLSNLLINAIEHNIPQGSIEIHVLENQLLIRNTGRALNLDPALLFERFRKGTDASGSAGLGLAIVRSICDSYGWKIDYSVDDPWHVLCVEF
ncbi:MAG TPA: HAMP domain-containing sensor histidine kinase [Saprospiraceae bacterium]|nr:HAMP domain-containing sensor histidine kinase [Saprospiraceae bacterium]HMQ82132.1 HAMP domain-containing sensor histidine kinase [Saprospiraceae bacterium]